MWQGLWMDSVWSAWATRWKCNKGRLRRWAKKGWIERRGNKRETGEYKLGSLRDMKCIVVCCCNWMRVAIEWFELIHFVFIIEMGQWQSTIDKTLARTRTHHTTPHPEGHLSLSRSLSFSLLCFLLSPAVTISVVVICYSFFFPCCCRIFLNPLLLPSLRIQCPFIQYLLCATLRFLTFDAFGPGGLH